MLTDMPEKGGCGEKQSESVVETLLLNLCQLLLPYLLIPVSLGTSLFLVPAIVDSRRYHGTKIS